MWPFNRLKGTFPPEKYRIVKLTYAPGVKAREWSVQRPTVSGYWWENVCLCETREDAERELRARQEHEIKRVEVVSK